MGNQSSPYCCRRWVVIKVFVNRSQGWEHLDSFCGYQQNQDELEGEMLESLSAFEREQSYYDASICVTLC